MEDNKRIYLHRIVVAGNNAFTFNEPFAVVCFNADDYEIVAAATRFDSDALYAVAADGSAALAYIPSLARAGSFVSMKAPTNNQITIGVATYNVAPPIPEGAYIPPPPPPPLPTLVQTSGVYVADGVHGFPPGPYHWGIDVVLDNSQYPVTYANNSVDQPAPLAVGMTTAQVTALGWYIPVFGE